MFQRKTWRDLNRLQSYLIFGENFVINLYFVIDVRSPYVTPELNNELQCNVGNIWGKITLYLYALKTA